MLLTGGEDVGGGVLMSSMLRIGIRGLLGDELPTDVRLIGPSPISSMLRTGERGFVIGDEERRLISAAFAAALAFESASSNFRTSLRSSSSTASKDIFCWFLRAMVEVMVESSPTKIVLEKCVFVERGTVSMLFGDNQSSRSSAFNVIEGI